MEFRRSRNKGGHPVLITVDIGNTNTAIGVFREESLIAQWRVSSDRDKTSDEYAVLLMNFLTMASVAKEGIRGMIISSVVPPLTPVFQQLCRRHFRFKPMVVGPGLKTGMPILYENPHEVGADRIVASVAAYVKYTRPVIICDFGTATTFDAVSGKGEYMGGAIAPGFKIAAEALYLRTAKLPHVEILKPEGIIGKTTVTSIQSGIYYGYIGLVTHIIQEMKKEMEGPVVVVSTGGFGEEVFNDIDIIDYYEPSLILDGLAFLFRKNS